MAVGLPVSADDACPAADRPTRTPPKNPSATSSRASRTIVIRLLFPGARHSATRSPSSPASARCLPAAGSTTASASVGASSTIAGAPCAYAGVRWVAPESVLAASPTVGSSPKIGAPARLPLAGGPPGGGSGRLLVSGTSAPPVSSGRCPPAGRRTAASGAVAKGSRSGRTAGDGVADPRRVIVVASGPGRARRGVGRPGAGLRPPSSSGAHRRRVGRTTLRRRADRDPADRSRPDRLHANRRRACLPRAGHPRADGPRDRLGAHSRRARDRPGGRRPHPVAVPGDAPDRARGDPARQRGDRRGVRSSSGSGHS